MSKKEIVKNSREKIIEFENALIANADGINIEGDGKHVVTESKIAPIKHTFADGVYIRQMDMAAGTVVVGAIHKHLHVWFLLEGDLTIATQDTVKNYVAPCYVISKPGTQRVLYANEDSVFVNIHKNPNEIKDIRELEKEWSALTQEEYDEYIKNK